jgi:hypothetical protein
MLIDFRESPEAAQVETDVCIAGAGAAGIPLARRLMEQGHSVCLLEGGGLQFDQDTQALFVGANLGMDYYDLVDARLRFFGGTTRIWGGRCALMDHIDFERRAWVPYSGWPIDRQDLEPYYRQAHEQFELDEFNYEQELWAALGSGTPSFDPARITTSLWRFDELSERYGPDRCRDLMDSDRVRILLHANVVQIQASDNARRVEHLVVKALDGQTCQVRARQYVLAAGAIENARLLLASSDIERSGGPLFHGAPQRPHRQSGCAASLRAVALAAEALHALRAAAGAGAATGGRDPAGKAGPQQRGHLQAAAGSKPGPVPGPGYLPDHQARHESEPYRAGPQSRLPINPGLDPSGGQNDR